MKLLDKPETKNYHFNTIVINTENLTLPKFNEQSNIDWVKYGENNLYPNELFDLFSSSGFHNAIIESRTRIITGDGFEQEYENDTDTKEFSQRTEDFIDKCNPYESLNEVFAKVTLDYELYGLAYLEIIWSKDKKSIAELYHLDASKIRWGKMNDKNKIDTYYYSRDWSNYRKDIYKPIPIQVFSDTNRGGRQILPIVRYTPTLDYYTFPDYIGGLKWITIDTEIANFHYSNLKNGLNPSLFIGFPVGQLTEEERGAIDEKIREKYQGTGKAGEYLLAFYDGEGTQKPEVQIISASDLDKQYDLLNRTTLQQILVSHKITNENLVGISTPGKLSNSSEIIQSFNLYFNTVIKPEQKKLVDVINKIFLINGFNPVYIENNVPVETSFSENIMAQILTQDEMRELIGYKPIENVTTEVETDSGVTFTSKGSTYTFRYDFGTLSRINVNTDLNDITDKNLNDIYLWRLGNKENPCPSCKGYSNQTRTLDSWLNTAIPGHRTGQMFNGLQTNFPYSPYGQFCEQACRCELRRIGKGI